MMRLFFASLALLAFAAFANAADVDSLLGKPSQPDTALEPVEPFYVYA